MKLELMYYGNPLLRKKAVPITEITDEIRQLVQDMRETMIEHNGIGLAAQQIGKAISLCITEVPIPVRVSEDSNEVRWNPGPLRVYINPKLIAHSEEQWTQSEGCLSIPGIYGDVTRPVHIKITATDLEGNIFEEELSWLDARAFMHENDHLNGVLCIDRVHGKERQALEPGLHAVKKKFSQR